MAKVKVTFDKKKLRRFQLKAKQVIGRIIEKEVLTSIARGVSPVKGQGRFKGYSDVYIDQIKGTSGVLSGRELKSFRASTEARKQNRAKQSRQQGKSLGELFGKRTRPINLRLSGDLIKSFFKKIIKSGVIIGFNHELARVHTIDGAGKSKVIRKMLPTGGEKFNRSITISLLESLKSLSRKIFR